MLCDDATVHEDHLVGHFPREADLVRHHNHRHAFFGEATYRRRNLTDEFWIQRRCGFVEKALAS